MRAESLDTETDFFYKIFEITLTYVPAVMLATVVIASGLLASGFRFLLGGVAMIFLIFAGAGFLGFSSTDIVINLFVVSALYASYCFLAASCWLIPQIYLRVIAVIVTVLPIGYGYVVASAGILGLGFVIDDEIRPPVDEQAMAPGLTCVTWDWGWAGDEGEDFDLYRSWAIIPFLKREVGTISVDFDAVADDGGSVGPLISCDSVLATYARPQQVRGFLANHK